MPRAFLLKHSHVGFIAVETNELKNGKTIKNYLFRKKKLFNYTSATVLLSVLILMSANDGRKILYSRHCIFKCSNPTPHF